MRVDFVSRSDEGRPSIDVGNGCLSAQGADAPRSPLHLAMIENRMVVRRFSGRDRQVSVGAVVYRDGAARSA